MEKEIKIIAPEGYEIDRENSTFECIKFKPKNLTYNDVAKALFENKVAYYANIQGGVGYAGILGNNSNYANPMYGVSSRQVNKLTALNKLINIAKYLNGDWIPNFNNQSRYVILLKEGTICVMKLQSPINISTPYFKSKELAEQAIEILGEETIRLILSQV